MDAIPSGTWREGVLAGPVRTVAAALRVGIAFRQATPAPRRLDRVSFDGSGVLRRLAEGGSEQLAWADLAEVGILTLDGDHWVDDLCWILVSTDRERGCAVPWGAEGAAELRERLLLLPGFDRQALRRALDCPHAGRFVCWRRGSGPVRPRLVGRTARRA